MRCAFLSIYSYVVIIVSGSQEWWIGVSGGQVVAIEGDTAIENGNIDRVVVRERLIEKDQLISRAETKTFFVTS